MEKLCTNIWCVRKEYFKTSIKQITGGRNKSSEIETAINGINDDWNSIIFHFNFFLLKLYNRVRHLNTFLKKILVGLSGNW